MQTFLISILHLQKDKLHWKAPEQEGCCLCNAQSSGINSIETKFCLWPKNNEMGFIKWKLGNSESGKALPIALGPDLGELVQ